MNKEQTQKAMEKCCKYYLDKHGTNGWEDFKKFMLGKGVPAHNLSYAAKFTFNPRKL